MRLLLVGLLVSLCLHCPRNVQAQSANVTVRIKYKDKSYYGKPLVWNGKDMMLLRRDGRTSLLPCRSQRDYKQVDNEFRPYSREQLRARLQQEFGKKYQISVTQHFVVVHPPGDYQQWAQPFEAMYVRFRAYFSSRGLNLREQEFPLVAVVLRTRHEFDRFLKTYHRYNKHQVGYYSPTSNRIITYDQKLENQSGQRLTTKTIIHEVAHQTAFNTGVHNRFGATPRWICEGLATMFEADGVNNSASYSSESDRINRGRLLRLQEYYRQQAVAGKLEQLVVSDQLFESDQELAYALSWGLTFYLAEKRPKAYFRFLNNDENRKDYSAYSPQDRLRDFAAVFGSDLASTEVRMKRYLIGLSVPKP